MPKIQIYQQQTRATQGLSIAAPSGGAVNGPTSALGEVAGALGSFSDVIKQREDERGAVWANDQAQANRAKWTEQLPKLMESAPEDGAGFHEQVLQQFDDETADVVQAAPNERSRNWLRSQLANQRNELASTSLQFQAHKASEFRTNALERGADSAANSLAVNPASFDTLLSEQTQAVRASGLSADAQAAQIDKSRQMLSYAAVDGMRRQNPYATLKELNAEKPTNSAVAALDFKSRQVLRNATETDIRQLEAKREALANRAEARGERALAQMDRQIASGIPATGEMWGEWATAVKGTTSEAEFGDRVKAEQEVQAVLLKPVDQQLSYVAQQEEKLRTEGGSIAQAQNVARLGNAVKQNVTLMQQAPLVYNAQRTGTDTPPIDFTQLSDANGAQQVASILSTRATTLDAMRKQYGAAVPMRPLLPQEAQMLSTQLERASPQEAVKFYASMYAAAGSPDVYKGILQQVAPDAPVKALAGLIASKPVDITTQHNLWRSNVTLPAHVVAETMLAGERLIDPSKSAKTEDGSPVKGLYLPEVKTLQDKFASQVGDAFQGRPAAAQTAFQAVQAYYVGKAAQTGRLASSKSDIDTGLVKEAITSTLGQAVNYNGNGTVLAPWGMDKGTFEDRVQSSFINEITRRGLPQNLRGLLPALGLRNKGDGTYYLTQGRNFLTDGKGQPIVVSVNAP